MRAGRTARSRSLLAGLAALLLCAGCAATATGEPSGTERRAIGTEAGAAHTVTPRAGRATATGHVVVVMMENHSYDDIIGSAQAPYLNTLARGGLSLSDMHAVTHPSQPNYIALFSGGTQGVTDDSCPQTLTATDLAGEMIAAGQRFTGYSEDLPAPGSTVCASGNYARKHVPWTDFTDDPSGVNQPFTAFPTKFATLPALSFVIPNLAHDMHDGTIAQGDTWLRANLAKYVHWTRKHNSLLIVTWDEDDYSQDNQIPTIVYGAGVTPSVNSTPYTHYSLLHGIEDRFGVGLLGASATAQPVPLG